jgi:DNA-binding winged helix-turn-helix (wHTH) protein
VRVYLSAIRRKLEPDSAHPRYFLTEPQAGIRFDPDGSTARQGEGRRPRPARTPSVERFGKLIARAARASAITWTNADAGRSCGRTSP